MTPRTKNLLVVLSVVFLLAAATFVRSARPTPQPPVFKPVSLEGVASFYGPGFEGQKTASGDVFHSYEFTAAHRTLPLGTVVRVTNLENRRSVVVEITDRGPYVRRRIIDLSVAAAKRLGMKRQGLVRVRVDILRQPSADSPA